MGRRAVEQREERWALNNPSVPYRNAMRRAREHILDDSAEVSTESIARAVISDARFLGSHSASAAAASLEAELTGLGVLQPLTERTDITDIYVNSPTDVWVRGRNGLEKSLIEFASEDEVRMLATRLVASAGRRLDDSNPCLDVRLPGRLRVHAVLPPVSTNGTLLSIRIQRGGAFSLDELAHEGTAVEPFRTVLAKLVDSRASFLVSGATGSGKTTLLNSLLSICPASERLVIVEDTAELEPCQQHWLRLESRSANTEQRGAVKLTQLVREALRMNPDRLVVGECRGAEVCDLFTALNTGHSGAGTVHANSASDVPARLLALGALAGWSTDAVTLQAAAALDVLIHLRQNAGVRFVAEVSLISAMGGQLRAVSALTRNAPRGRAQRGPGWHELRSVLGISADSEWFFEPQAAA